jgi:uroporphyrinogen decarboxylase
LGFDGIQSLEPTAGVDIFSLFERYRNRICFIGNLDVSNLLSFGTPLEVKKYVNHLMRHARKYGCSLIISPTQQILSSVKPENVNKMIQTAKNGDHFEK